MKRVITVYECDSCGDQSSGVAMELRTPFLTNNWPNSVDMGPAGGFDVIQLCEGCKHIFLEWILEEPAQADEGSSEPPKQITPFSERQDVPQVEAVSMANIDLIEEDEEVEPPIDYAGGPSAEEIDNLLP